MVCINTDLQSDEVLHGYNMPIQCCVAADGMPSADYSFHKFPSAKDCKEVHIKWIKAGKQCRKDQKGPSTKSQLCLRHFKAVFFFLTEGKQFQELMGIPPQKLTTGSHDKYQQYLPGIGSSDHI